MTLAYFDCFSGISGDMTLGALVDAGVGIDALRAELAKLGLPGYEIKSEKVMRAGLAATKVHVILNEQEQPARHLSDIRRIIEASTLSSSIKQKSIAIFVKLAEAYGHVGMKIEKAGDVEGALREALALKDRLVFMDFITDETENVFPMIPGGKGLSEMILAEEL